MKDLTYYKKFIGVKVSPPGHDEDAEIVAVLIHPKNKEREFSLGVNNCITRGHDGNVEFLTDEGYTFVGKPTENMYWHDESIIEENKLTPVEEKSVTNLFSIDEL